MPLIINGFKRGEFVRFRQTMIITLLALVTACSKGELFDVGARQKAMTPDAIATDDTGEPKIGAGQVFQLAEEEVKKQNYSKALDYYGEVERLYPGSSYATDARIKGAWAQYKLGKFSDAITALEQFIIRHPNSDQLPYAYWLVGLCYYERMPNPQRDQRYTLEAMKNFRTVIDRWPHTEYAKDARVKRDILVDQLAAKEMDIGRQYLKKQNYSAAINRFQYVVEKFQTSSHTAEALYRQVEAYSALGVADEAKRVAEVLGHNYPGSQWYSYAYKVVNGQKVEEKKLFSRRSSKSE